MPESTRIFVNHLGFASDSPKHVVITDPPEDRFEVVSRMTKQVVLEGRLEQVSGDLGEAWVGCFSEIREEGTYLIRCGGAESRIITVWDGVYDYPRRVLFNYFPSQRCGDTPLGWNSPCHVHDGRRVDTGEHVDVTGGWHQSGDLRKWTWGTSHGLLGLSRALLTARPKWDSGQMADEIRWGNQYFHKMVRADGGLMDHVILPLGWEEERDLYANDAPPVAMFLVLTGQAHAARVFADIDPAYARQCLDVAERLWAYLTSPDRPATPYNPAVLPKHHDWLAYACTQNYPGSSLHWLDRVLAGVAMYEATGAEQWLDEATRAATKACTFQAGGDVAQDPAAACFRVSPDRPDLVCSCLDGPLARIALCDLLRLRPAARDTPQWREAVRLYAEQCRIMAGRNPWGLVPTCWYSEPPEGARPAGSAYYKYFFKLDCLIGGVNYDSLAIALFLVRAAELFGEEAYRAVAFRQLDWILGCNPMDASTVEGVGLNQPERFINPREFFPPTPQIPGAVMTGITGDDDDEPTWRGCAHEYDMPPTAMLLWLLSELCG